MNTADPTKPSLAPVLTGIAPPAAAASLAAGKSERPAELFAGRGREDISPPPGFPNVVIKDADFDEVLSPLFARALVLSDGRSKIAVLQWDLLTTGDDAVVNVRRLVSAATGIPAGNILVNAAHSHSSPFAPGDGNSKTRENAARVKAKPELNAQWEERLFAASVAAVNAANSSLQPVTLEVGRATVPEWQYSRRPRRPDGTVETIFVPADPYTMPAGLRFGPSDPTLTLLVFRDVGQRPIVTLFNYPCHAVSVYVSGVTYVAGQGPETFPYSIGSKAVSADWPGFAAEAIEAALGGRAIFLQGCAGDLVPARRGVEAAREMGRRIGERGAAAAVRGLRIDVDKLEAHSCRVGLPLNPATRAEKGTDLTIAEVQAFVLGSVAIVALPGEPMIEIAIAIQRGSPFPHTAVLGYSNGDGVIYVGMPGELARGGYGADKTALGTDECGAFLVDSALRLLREIAAR